MLELLHGPDRTANSMELLARICENAAHGVAGQIESFRSSIRMKRSVRCASAAAIRSAGMPRF